MKTSQEFFERLQSDAAFANQIQDALVAKRADGAKTIHEAVIPVAADAGYEVKAEDIDCLLKQYEGDISEDELGKIAGGLCFTMLISLAITAAPILTKVLG